MRPERISLAVGVGAAALLLGAQLLVRPIVGLADNGDFIKVMAPAGLAYADRAEDRYFQWAPAEFAFAQSHADPDGSLSSETLLARGAVAASKLAGSRLFDIRALGALHAGLLLGALALMLSACADLAAAARWTAVILLVVVFTDVAYAAPLNSLYGQAASLLFLMLTAGIGTVAIRRGVLAGPWLLAYFVCAALFVCSKPQESLQAPLLAVFGLRLAGSGRPRRAAAIGLGVLMLAGAFVYYRTTPESMRRVALYHAVFYELLPNSPDPVADLGRLGLPRELVRFAGIDAYDPRAPLGVPSFRTKFDGKVGYSALAGIYLSDPGRFVSVLRRAAWKGAQRRPPNFGDLAKEAGAPPHAKSRRFAAWSDLQFRARPGTKFLWTALLAGTLSVALTTWRRAPRRGRLAREGLILLCAMAALELLVCAFADAHIELVRHLYVFHALVDLVLIADAAWLVQILGARPAFRRAVAARPA